LGVAPIFPNAHAGGGGAVNVPAVPRASAVRAPATPDQVDAYRFGLRRLEAALVRGDPVPLHEQIRSQRRAVLAGVVLGLLGLCVAGALTVVAPTPRWEREDVVVGAGSGAMYVVAHQPDRLVPVANLPAARLVLAALRSGGSTAADPATAVPVTVPDARLDAAPRTPTAALPGALAVRPDASALPERWAVCDQVTGDGELVATTVVGGAAAAAPNPPGDGVLLGGPDGSTWLVVGGQRHRVDTGDGRVAAAFGLTGRVPRAAAQSLISLLPEGPELATPAIPDRGDPAPGGLPGRVGDVLIASPVGAAPRFYVVLADGLQEVPEVLAELLRVASGARAAREVEAADLAGADIVDDLPTAGWPAGAPRTLDPAEAPVVCWTWSGDGDPAGSVWTGGSAPLPSGTAPVALAQADGAGERVDAAAVGPGGAVRTGEVGPLWLVSTTGVVYGVADAATGAALGVRASARAPGAALSLLPAGPTLDMAEATRVVDVLPSP
jgi:type VII secretion protein EccB